MKKKLFCQTRKHKTKKNGNKKNVEKKREREKKGKLFSLITNRV